MQSGPNRLSPRESVEISLDLDLDSTQIQFNSDPIRIRWLDFATPLMRVFWFFCVGGQGGGIGCNLNTTTIAAGDCRGQCGFGSGFDRAPIQIRCDSNLVAGILEFATHLMQNYDFVSVGKRGRIGRSLDPTDYPREKASGTGSGFDFDSIWIRFDSIWIRWAKFNRF